MDWKQDSIIGIHQGCKNTSFRPKIDLERSKTMQMKLENY